jgi:Type II secretion system (T2SS), protein E, N-terminal domain
MGNEDASLRIMDCSPMHSQAYEVIETLECLAASVERIIVAQVQQVALVTIGLSFEAGGKLAHAQPACNDPQACILYLLQGLRPLVRKSDNVCLFNRRLYFFLRGADIQGAQIVQDRLWEASLWRIHNSSEGEMVRPRSIVSGLSAYPSPSRTIEQFIETGVVNSHHADFGSEKPVRKSMTGRARAARRSTTDEELPALARKLGIPYLYLLPRKPPGRVRQLVNPRLAQELRCYPLGRERNMLTVAMLDPQDRLALARLHQETGLEIFPVLTHPRALQTALEQLI